MTKTKWCVIQKTKTKTKSEFAVKINTAQWWNKLPTDVRTAEPLATFHKRLKTHLFRLQLNPA